MVSRIKQLLDWQQLSPTQFADRIGVGRPVVSHILSERNKPSLDVVRQIRAAFPLVSLDWLLDGTGSMLLQEPAVASAAAPAASQAPVAPVAAPVAPTAVPSAAQPQPEPINSAVSAPLPFAASVAAPGVANSPAPAPNSYPLPQPASRPAIPRFRPGPAATNTPPTASAEAAYPAATELPSASAAVAGPGGPAPSNQIANAPAALPVATGAAMAVPAYQPVPATEPAPPVAEAPPAPVEAAPAKASGLPTLADVFGESGKAIRRIVIFYRDGSFADYQPEA